MSNEFKEIDINNRICYFFAGTINIQNLDPNKIKIAKKKSYKNIFIYYIGYVTAKTLAT